MLRDKIVVMYFHNKMEHNTQSSVMYIQYVCI